MLLTCLIALIWFLSHSIKTYNSNMHFSCMLYGLTRSDNKMYNARFTKTLSNSNSFFNLHRIGEFSILYDQMEQ